MATSARKHTVPAGGELPERAAINRLADSIIDIVPVANTTARAQLLVDLGWAPSTARPLLVFRGDAPAGGEIEYTVDGTNWRTLWAPAKTPVGISGVGGWDAGAEPPRVRRVGLTVIGSGLLQKVSTSTTVGYTGVQVGTVPAGYEPFENSHWLVTNNVGSNFSLEFRANGQIWLRRMAGGDMAVPAGSFFSLAAVQYATAA